MKGGAAADRILVCLIVQCGDRDVNLLGKVVLLIKLSSHEKGILKELWVD